MAGEMERLLQAMNQPNSTNQNPPSNTVGFVMENILPLTNESVTTELNPPDTWGSFVWGESVWNQA